MSPRQLPLDLPLREARGAEDFLVAPCNEDAVAWLDRWPDWPHFALAVTGAQGSGKSHLAHVFATRGDAAIVAAGALAPAMVPDLAGASAAVVVEDAERGVDEESLLHLYNALKEAGGWLLLTAETPPARWNVALPDLSSRLATVPTVAIGAPDDTVIAAVLVKLFADRQLKVDEAVVTYLLRHMERSFAAARAVVAAIDRLALERGRRITVPLVRDALAGGET